MKMKEKDFHKMLNFLAKQANYELDTDTIEFYDKCLSRYGYPRVCDALCEILMKRRANDRFPSVSDIAECIEPRISDKAIATDLVSLLMVAMSRKGRYWADNIGGGHAFKKIFIDEYGKMAWEVVQKYGGWKKMCFESDHTDAGIFKAQMRMLIEGMVQRENNQKRLGTELKLLN